MSWIKEALRQRGIAQQKANEDEERGKSNFEHLLNNTRVQLNKYDQLIAPVLIEVGESLWGHSIFSIPKYRIQLMTHEMNFSDYQKGTEFYFTATWYLISETESVNLHHFGKVPVGCQCALIFYGSKTILQEQNQGWYESAVTFQTVQSCLKELITVCIKKGLYGIDINIKRNE